MDPRTDGRGEDDEGGLDRVVRRALVAIILPFYLVWQASKGLIRAIELIVTAIGTGARAVAGALARGIARVGHTLGAIGRSIVDVVVGAVHAVTDPIVHGLQSVAHRIVVAVVAAVGAVVHALRSVAAALGRILEPPAAAVRRLLRFVGSILQAIGATIASAATATGRALGRVLRQIAAAVAIAARAIVAGMAWLLAVVTPPLIRMAAVALRWLRVLAAFVALGVSAAWRGLLAVWSVIRLVAAWIAANVVTPIGIFADRAISGIGAGLLGIVTPAVRAIAIGLRTARMTLRRAFAPVGRSIRAVGGSLRSVVRTMDRARADAVTLVRARFGLKPPEPPSERRRRAAPMPQAQRGVARSDPDHEIRWDDLDPDRMPVARPIGPLERRRAALEVRHPAHDRPDDPHAT